MLSAALTEREEAAVAAPHLSFSRLSRYLHCPEQYRLYYIEDIRRKLAAASLVFGQVIHGALAALFRSGEDAVAFFQNIWREAKDYDLDYARQDSWDKFHTGGQALLERFLRDESRRLDNVAAVKKAFELRITNLDLPLIGVIDLVADLDGKRSFVDFKTASSAYEDHEALLSDQLTAYQLAVPDAEQAALCVLVKTKEPQIEWHRAARNGERLVEFLAKAEYLAREIAAGRSYKWPGKWCSWCDYLPVCLGDKTKVSETMIQIR